MNESLRLDQEYEKEAKRQKTAKDPKKQDKMDRAKNKI